MPELPEVETTVRGLKKEVLGLKILDVWTDLNTGDKRKADTIANPKYFRKFKKEVSGKKIISTERRAKNILINLSGEKTILVHLKMTGYLFVGKYTSPPNPLSELRRGGRGRGSVPLPKYTHFVFYLTGGKLLAFSDLRKFGKMALLDTNTAHDSKHLKDLGLEPLSKNFDLKTFKERIFKKPNGKIKTVLMDQTLVVGIGNIYSDEILWRAGVHPKRAVKSLKEKELRLIFKATRELLRKGIAFGGDSMSDYLNIYGLPGKFQLKHKAYGRTGEKCSKKGCQGVIIREIINNRSAHFCSKHQV